MVSADLFLGSLAVWNTLDFAIHFAHPPIPSHAPRGEGRIPFKLIQGYTANWRRVQESNLLGIAPTGFRNQRITGLPTLQFKNPALRGFNFYFTSSFLTNTLCQSL